MQTIALAVAFIFFGLYWPQASKWKEKVSVVLAEYNKGVYKEIGEGQNKTKKKL